MPRPKAAASLALGVESKMDEDSVLPDALPTPDPNQENAKPAAKGRGREKASSAAVTKAKPARRRASGGVVTEKKKTTAKKSNPKRGPLKEQPNTGNPEDTEEVDEFGAEGHNEGQSAVSADELVAVKQPAKKAPAGAKRKNQAKKKQTDSETLQQIKGTANDKEFEYTPVTARQTKPSKKPAGRPATKQRVLAEAAVTEQVIPDTQDVVMDIVPGDLPLQSEDEEVPQSVFRRTNNAQSRKQPPPLVRKRAGSVSDTERGVGDPVIRRKLGEMTKKFENLDTKYKALKDVGIIEAEANLEKLKLSSENKSKGTNFTPANASTKLYLIDIATAANELIVSLKKELATQKALAQESRTLQKQIAAKDTEVSKAQALATELSNSLSEAQNENKVLQAKVASARSASATIESASSKPPGSAMKGKGSARTIMVGSAEAAQAAQAAQLKEDLYRDLTGLLVLGVERGGEADTYDCIQTGRNGSKSLLP